MAVTVTTDLVTLFDANTSFGGQDTYSGFQRFGTACNGLQVGNATQHITGSVTAFNFTGSAIYVWMLGPASIGTIAQGGFRIAIGDGTNTRAYFVGGRDTPAFTSQGWNCYVLHSGALPSDFAQLAGSSEPNLSSISVIGVGFTNTAKATGNSPNCFFDVMRYGTGLTVEGSPSDPGTFLDIVELDDSINNAWGIIRELDQAVYGCQGRLTFGSSVADTTFAEENTYLIFESRQVPIDFYTITTIGGESNNNVFRLGEKVGTGENATGIAGVTILSNVGLELNLSSSDSDILLYGSNIIGSDQGITLSSTNSSSEVNTTIFTNCGDLQFGNAFVRNSSINNSTLILDSLTNIARMTFNGAGGGHGIQVNTTGTFNFNDVTFINYGANETLDAGLFNNSGGLVTINVFDGNSPTVRNSAGSSTVINNPTTFTVVNIIEDSEVRIFRQADLEELGGVESVDDPPVDVNNVTVTPDPENIGRFRVVYSYNHSVDIPIFLVIFKQTRIPIYQPLTLTANDSSFFASQVFDRQFQPGSGT